MIKIDRTIIVIISLIQIVFWMALWLINDYLAVLLSSIFIPIFLGVLVVSSIADMLDKSFVGKKYYAVMLISFIIPSIIFLFFNLVVGFEMSLF